MQLCGIDNTVIRMEYIDGLVQDRSNSSALAMELLQSCAKPSTCSIPWAIFVEKWFKIV